jgi:hypothetical protein
MPNGPLGSGADDFPVTFRLVFCLGDPTHVSTFQAYLRPAIIDVPAPRGDTVLCPVADTLTVPTVVVDSRLGGGTPVLAIWSDGPVDGAVGTALRADPAWQPLTAATELRGEVFGVFLDPETTDLFGFDSWPEWNTDTAHLLVAIGMLNNMNTIDVFGLTAPTREAPSPIGEPAAAHPADTPTTAPDTDGPPGVVNLSDWRANRHS